MPKTILVADDSLTIRKVIAMVFSAEDIQITAVDNGVDAIARARELKPALVLADVTMPGKSGYDVCEALKNDPATHAIPVMLLAGSFEPFDENRSRAVGAKDFIVKPFESQVLLDKVHAIIGGVAPLPLRPPSAVAGAGPRPSAPMAGMATSAPRASPPVPLPPGGLPRGPGPGMAGVPQPMPGPAGIPRPQGQKPMAVPAAAPRPGMAAPGMGSLGAPQGMRSPMAAPASAQPGVPRPGMPVPGPGLGMGMGMAPPGGALPRQGFGAPPAAVGFPRPPGPGMAARPMAAPANPEAVLRDALSKASREMIEKIAWEVVPQLAETIIREQLERLMKERERKG